MYSLRQFEARPLCGWRRRKLKGLSMDVGGQMVASDPGVIRMRGDLPEGYVGELPPRSGWLR